MSTNKQTPPAAINEDEIYSGAEANNVESSRTQAPDVESETEEECQQTRKNFSEEEDKQLCRSYLLITLDVVHGTEQKGETFWSRIEENYKQAMGANYFERHVRALPARWQIINKAVNKFSGILSQVERSNASGSNDESNEDKAKQIYRAEVKANFNLMHCKKILDRHPKWQDYQDKKKKNKGKVKDTTANTIASCATAAVQEDEDDNEGPSTRPLGRKQVKANEALKRKRNDQRDAIIRNQEELIRRGNERAKLMKEALKVSQQNAMAAKLQVEMTIMEKDPADIADPVRRRWLENAQRLIMAQIEVLPAEEIVEDSHDNPEDA